MALAGELLFQRKLQYTAHLDFGIQAQRVLAMNSVTFLILLACGEGRDLQSKESGPRGPGFDLPPEGAFGVFLPTEVRWSNGIMEWWSNGKALQILKPSLLV